MMAAPSVPPPLPAAGAAVEFEALGLGAALGLALVLANGVGEPDGTGSLWVSSGCGLSVCPPAAAVPGFDCPPWTIRATATARTTSAAPNAVSTSHRRLPPLPSVPFRCRVTRALK